jgi:RNA polymerase sigma-70 factor (ECF subfamily)
VVDHLFRRSAGQVVATLTRVLGPQHLDLVEDVVQETLLKALRQWPHYGVPERPDAWLFQVARNQALDLLRRERALREKHEAIAQALSQQPYGGEPSEERLDSTLEDDQLRMMFTCCHPALAREAQVALTLKTLGGFGVPEIAHAFLAQESTIAQRLVRAKRFLRERAVAFGVPNPTDLPPRLDAVLEVLYLLFNEGYSASLGEDLVRADLCAEAIRLGLIVAQHPAGDVPKSHALLALMLLQAARLPGRTDAAGDLLTLEEQDRRLWDHSMAAMGLEALARSAAGDEVTPYHIQAAIAACHAVAPTYAETDWNRILAHYDELLAMLPASPVVLLNHAVALAMVRGPQAGLAELLQLRALPGMRAYHLLHATSAELWSRLGNREEACVEYERALALALTEPERRFLQRKLSELPALNQQIQ